MIVTQEEKDKNEYTDTAAAIFGVDPDADSVAVAA